MWRGWTSTPTSLANGFHDGGTRAGGAVSTLTRIVVAADSASALSATFFFDVGGTLVERPVGSLVYGDGAPGAFVAVSDVPSLDVPLLGTLHNFELTLTQPDLLRVASDRHDAVVVLHRA